MVMCKYSTLPWPFELDLNHRVQFNVTYKSHHLMEGSYTFAGDTLRLF